jgi:GDPmannose 4,6-dehydratase
MRALVTGIGGQDGSYLAELLVAEGHDVVGMVREPLHRERPNLAGVRDRVSLVPGDLHDAASLRAALEAVRPQVLFHLAAPTFVPDSWRDPAATLAAVAGATGTLLSAAHALDARMRVVVCGSGAMFGAARESPQHEGTPPSPSSPYGVAKLAAHQLVGVMRDEHGMHASTAIAYNHESPRRPEQFVTRKVTRAAAAIALGLQEELVLGDLGAVRDWSDARDVVRGLALMAAADEPGDYVLASGTGHSVGELVDTAFAAAGADPAGRVRSDPALVRGPEPVAQVGDPSLARTRLGWEARTSFEALIGEMVAADLERLRAEGDRAV